ncbi:Ig-like domain-containing protein [Streptosporangium sp. NPDC004379]|uniref:L,D-transpeptidase n=1 Tax=Streptosporangium sp. NPDC004379 TaxID=3366189 RepID=UPI0036CAEC12
MGEKVVLDVERRSLRTPLAAMAMTTAALLATSCSGGTAAPDPAAEGQKAPAKETPAGAAIKITPGQGSGTVAPNRKIVVTAAGGPLEEVTAESDGKPVEGTFDTGRTKWVSKRALKPSTAYTVSARAGATTAQSSFTTRKPKVELKVSDVTPALKGEKVGIGAPIIVTFNNPVTNKAAVEKALHVESEKPSQGAWRWTSDTTVIYRTAKFWQPHQKVTFRADITGVQSGKDAYGVEDFTKTIRIGAAQTAVVNARTHKMVVKRDGKVVKTMLISAGNGSTREYTTTSGVHLTMGKANPERMISPGRKKGDPGYYDLMINHAVRFSNSGEYVHALNNVWAQGRQNVSHGCINARPDQAKWFYDQVQRGDVITITGTSRKLEWNNGWGFWQMPFSQWKKGSALTGADS